MKNNSLKNQTHSNLLSNLWDMLTFRFLIQKLINIQYAYCPTDFSNLNRCKDIYTELGESFEFSLRGKRSWMTETGECWLG